MTLDDIGIIISLLMAIGGFSALAFKLGYIYAKNEFEKPTTHDGKEEG